MIDANYLIIDSKDDEEKDYRIRKFDTFKQAVSIMLKEGSSVNATVVKVVKDFDIIETGRND